MRAVGLILLVGCDGVFGLIPISPGTDGPVADGAPPTDALASTCRPLTFDPYRYHLIPPMSVMGWGTSNTACGQYGMELASLDAGDTEELANEGSYSTTPYWLGTKFEAGWSALDGCAPYLSWAPQQPNSEQSGDCIEQGSDGMHSAACGGAGAAVGALCETPRPSAPCSALTSTYASVDVTNHSRGYADNLCATSSPNTHVVEINSSAELMTVLGMFPSVASFWVSATYNGTQFVDATSCPEVFAWASGQPNFNGTDVCVIYTRGVGMELHPCSFGVATICETNE